MKEYGGYLPLELIPGKEYFHDIQGAKIERYNCGRNAIAAAALSLPDVCLCIPHYNCNVVVDTLKYYNISYREYYLDDNMEPADVILRENEWLLYVNYFGVANREKIERIAQKYERVIFDNTQAFFSAPILDGKCFNVYSPRKFVGLCDGAYLIWSGEHTIDADYPLDVSWERAFFLFKSIELGTNAAYQDNLNSKIPLADGIKRMSVLTQKMLCSIDYAGVAQRRHNNYKLMREIFADYNQLNLPLEGFAPFVYPLYIENDELRAKVVQNKIYAPQWWKYLLEKVPADSIEAKLSRWLVPIPIDQRYNEQDMRDIADIVLKCLDL